jgi:hypothetical protein
MSGTVLWETILPGPVSGHPVTFEVEGREYIAVPAGGNTASPERRALSLHPEIKVPAGVNGLFVFALDAPAQGRRSMAAAVPAVAAALAAFTAAGVLVAVRARRRRAVSRRNRLQKGAKT